MRLLDLSPDQVRKQLADHTLRLKVGPFVIRLGGYERAFAELLHVMYGDFELADDSLISDFNLRLKRPWGLRRWWRPTVEFVADIKTPMAPFPLNHAYPLFEWGLNWSIAVQAHQFLMLHSAVLEKNGRALVMPAEPGSGKSTLAAALMLRGWRLLSDEFGLIRPDDEVIQFYPLPRPLPLKNESIEIIKKFAPECIMGPVFPKTRKGDIAHLKASAASLPPNNEPATVAWVIFPKYEADEKTHLEEQPAGRSFMRVSGNSFNYPIQGGKGFRAIWRLIRQTSHYNLTFSDLDEAVAILDGLAEQTPEQQATAATEVN